MNNKKLKVAFTKPGNPDHTLGRAFNESLTWRQLVDRLSTAKQDKVSQNEFLALKAKDQGAHKNLAGAFIGGEFRTIEEVLADAASLGSRAADYQKSGRNRNAREFKSRSVATLDIDANAHDLWGELQDTGSLSALEGLTYHVHTTRKHTDEKPRLRIVIPLTRAVTIEEYTPLILGLFEKLDSTMAIASVESLTAVQVMFLPTISTDGIFHHFNADGEWLNPDDILDDYPADNSDVWPVLPNGKRLSAYELRKLAHPEDKKHTAPIITAVHRAFDPEEFIERFLSDFYEQAGDRYLRIGSSDAPAVRLYEHAFIHSDHGTDPANGQHNCFDCGRLWMFGNLDEGYDIEAMGLSNVPSFVAMKEFMLKQPEVREAMEEIEEELEEERTALMLGMLGMLEDFDDADDEDDLIGDTKSPGESAPTTLEGLVTVLRKRIRATGGLGDLDALLKSIARLPEDDFGKTYRNLLAVDVQEAMKNLGHPISKADAKSLLRPTIEDLREQRKGKPIPEWLENWVYISSQNKFFNTVSHTTLAKEGFNGKFQRQAGDDVGRQDTGLPRVAPADVALGLYYIPEVYDTRYYPGAAPVFEDAGRFYVNSYLAPDIQRGDYTGRDGVKLLKRLMTDLFPEEEHRSLVMDFLVHVVRNPGQKLRYAMVVKGCEDEGKSLLSFLVTKLIGDSNAGLVGTKQLKKEFNGWAADKVFATIEEIRLTGKESIDVLNDLKPVISNPVIGVEKKGLDIYESQNFCNLYITTNFEDAIPLDIDNTRYMVLFTRFRSNQEVIEWKKAMVEKEGSDYTVDLFNHIRNHPWQFWAAFQKYQFSQWYAPTKRAPVTRFKAIMSEDSKSEERHLLDTTIEDGKYPTLTDNVFIWDDFKALLDASGCGQHLRGRGVPSFMKSAGFVRARDAMDKEVGKMRIWTRNLAMLTSENYLTEEGRVLAKAAIIDAEDDDDLV